MQIGRTIRSLVSSATAITVISMRVPPYFSIVKMQPRNAAATVTLFREPREALNMESNWFHQNNGRDLQDIEET